MRVFVCVYVWVVCVWVARVWVVHERVCMWFCGCVDLGHVTTNMCVCVLCVVCVCVCACVRVSVCAPRGRLEPGLPQRSDVRACVRACCSSVLCVMCVCVM